MFQIKYVYDLVDKISPQLKTIQSNLQQTASKVEASANKIASGFQTIQKNLKNFGNETRGIGLNLAPLSIGIAGASLAALKSTANFETLAMQMEVLTGSAKAGKDLFDKLVKLGAETPFELKDLAKSTNMLMGYGQTAKDAFNNIKLIGDISAVSGGDLQGIALAFGQASAAGRLMGQDLLQLVNNGVPIMDMLSKTMKVPKERIKDLVSQGAVSFPILVKAFQEATSKGGRFENGMQKLSGTLSGLYSTLKDNLNIALASFGNEIVKTLDLKNKIKSFNDTIANLTERFKNLSPETKKIIIYLSLFIAIAGPLLIIIGQMAIGIVALTAVFNLLLASPIVLFIMGIAGAIIYFNEELTATYNFLKDNFLAVFDWIVLKIETVINKIIELKNKFLEITGLGKMGELFNMAFGSEQSINQVQPINQSQSLTAGGQLDINFNNMPKGSNANFTPVKNSFMQYNVGTNSVYAQ